MGYMLQNYRGGGIFVAVVEALRAAQHTRTLLVDSQTNKKRFKIHKEHEK